MDFRLRQTRDADHFVARTFALDDGQAGGGKSKQLGEESETGFVGRPFDRRRRQFDLELVTGQARHLVAGGTGLDADGQSGLRLGASLSGHRRYS